MGGDLMYAFAWAIVGMALVARLFSSRHCSAAPSNWRRLLMQALP